MLDRGIQQIRSDLGARCRGRCLDQLTLARTRGVGTCRASLVQLPHDFATMALSFSWEPLGSSGSASDNELGHWLSLSQDLIMSGEDSAAALPLPPLLPGPRDWPAVFTSSKALKRLINKQLKGSRCRAVEPAPREQQAALSRVVLHPLHSCRNALRLSERLGWSIVKGFRVFEIAADPSSSTTPPAYLAMRHWWSATESGMWIDGTPPLLASTSGESGA